MSCCGKLNKAKNIVKGISNAVVGYTTDTSSKRLETCKKCNDKKIIASFGKKNVYICKHCSCLIEAKVTIDNEKCPLNKW
jgi:sulfur relay (sulfurtransferase) DsrF/TusC family protein